MSDKAETIYILMKNSSREIQLTSSSTKKTIIYEKGKCERDSLTYKFGMDGLKLEG